MKKARSRKPGPSKPGSHAEQARFARRVLRAEADAISRIRIGPEFHKAVELVLRATASNSPGSVVVTGLGKNGPIGQKLSATFASTGTSSHFLHPTEALHGDLGRVRREDVLLALSFSGATDEIVSLVSILRQDRVPVITIVGQPDCDLARLAAVALYIGDVTEACPLNLAPTASTTATLALGDALALAVAQRRNFGVDDFRKFHPGGALGRQLTPVVNAMRMRAGHNLPLISSRLTIGEAFARADAQSRGGRRAGALILVDGKGKLAGIFTDADLRRLLLNVGPTAWDQPIRSVMTVNPRRLTDRSLIRDAVQMVREHRIDEIPVVDGADRPLGLIDVQDLMALKVIEG